jgi:hypothetical protein
MLTVTQTISVSIYYDILYISIVTKEDGFVEADSNDPKERPLRQLPDVIWKQPE